MNMVKWPFFILFFFTSSAFSQHALFLKNGELSRFRTLKQLESHIQIVTADGKKVKIDTSDFIGYYDDQIHAMFFKKPVDLHNGRPARYKYQIVERVIAGKINLYRIYHYSGGVPNTYGGGIRSVYYFAEKKNSFKTVYFNDPMNDHYESGSTDLRLMIKDDTLTLKTIDSEDFIYKESNIIELIKGYNLRSFKSPKIDDHETLGTVSFYSKAGPEKSKDIVIRVNDSVPYKLIEKFPTPIKMPAFAPMKVCVTWGSKDFCDLVVANPFEVIYYELVYSPKRETFELEKRNENQVWSYTASYVLKKP